MKKFRKNNKGFSLIELIIVVAIMVALIVVLAPQYLKQVEKARVAADEDIITEFANALKVAAIDEDYQLDGAEVKIDDEGTDGDAADAALKEYYGENYTDAKLKSKTYESGVTIKLSVDSKNSATVSFDGYPVD